MKTLVVLLIVSSVAQAAPKTAEVFKAVTYAQPQCYGREYSRQELAAHPKQTVEQIKAKLVKYSADPKEVSAGLKIELRLKGETGLNYHNEFVCYDVKNEATCAIECDGGSVVIGKFDSKTMTLKSNGFIIKGGCDSDDGEKTKFLDALKGGDDVFSLQALPPSYCSDAPAEN